MVLALKSEFLNLGHLIDIDYGVRWVAHVILVSSLGPNPSFFPFLRDFYLTLGSVGRGALTWMRA